MHPSTSHALHRLTLAMIALASLAAGCHSANSRQAGKPAAPIALSIEPRGELRRGETGEVTVWATVLIDSSDFSLDVELPRGMALYSGDLHQRGPVRANTRFRLNVAIRVPDQGSHVISASARLRAEDAGAFEATASYRTGSAATTVPHAAGTTHHRAGERIREFSVP